MTTATILACAASHLSVWGAGLAIGRHVLARRSRPLTPSPAINVVNGIVLPMVDDVRWERRDAADPNIVAHAYKLGPVDVWLGRLSGSYHVVIDGRGLAGSERYGEAVIEAQCARVARETLARQSRAVDAFMNGGET